MARKKIKVIRMPLTFEQINKLSDQQKKGELVRFLLMHEDKFHETLNGLKGKEFINAYMEIFAVLDFDKEK